MKNTVTIRFESDRVLTQDEVDNLIHAIYAQVREPADADGVDETYRTINVELDFEGEA